MQEFIGVRISGDSVRAIPDFPRSAHYKKKDGHLPPLFSVYDMDKLYTEVSPGYVVQLLQLTSQEVDIVVQNVLLECIPYEPARTSKYEELTDRVGGWDESSLWWLFLELDGVIKKCKTVGKRVQLFVPAPGQEK